MSECSNDCSNCSSTCSEKKTSPKDLLEKPHELSNIKKVIAIVSGKGGVGKSLVTSMMAVLLNRQGKKTAILDADITGPSIPKVFGLKGKADASESGLFPIRTKTGIEVISINLLLEDVEAPVIWRGPIIADVVKQFWQDVIWNDVDFMFVDMPPGTGDVPLTVFQTIPLDGIIVVTSPQELVSMIVTKAVNMAKMMDIPILGIVENMSYVECSDCKKRINVFGESHVDDIAKAHGIEVLAKIPLNPDFAKLCDNGCIELFEGDWLDNAANKIYEL